jgi:DNA-binding response OmpR family regulator
MNNVFVVDTDSDTIANINNILDASKWKLSVINSGEECLDTIKNGNYSDAIILGMQLKDMTGLDLVERIRDYSDVPVIVLSEDKDIYTLVKSFDSGANDYIVKPFNRAIFVARLEALIRRRTWDVSVKKS